MNDLLYLQILAMLFMIPGFGIVYLAKFIVDKYKLNEKAVCNFKHELTDEQLIEYKLNKAVVNIKILGFFIALPGVILLLVSIK